MFGPRICNNINIYLDSYCYYGNNNYTKNLKRDWYFYYIYGQLVIIIITLFYSLFLFGVSIYHAIRKKWIDPLKEIDFLICGIAISLLSAGIITYFTTLNETIYYTILFGNYNIIFYIQEWTIITSLYYLTSIGYLIDIAFICDTRYKNDD